MLRSFQRIRPQLLTLTSKQMVKTTIAKRFLVQRSCISPLASFPARSVIKSFNCNQSFSFHSSFGLFKAEEPQEEEEKKNHQMLIGFTCKVCSERSHHVMSKIAYTKGVVLIQCPGCKNRHLIADNLGWFRDSKTTVEDLVKEKGEAIRKIIVDDQGVERVGDLMEWLPDIVEEEKQRKNEAKEQAEALRKEKGQDVE